MGLSFLELDEFQCFIVIRRQYILLLKHSIGNLLIIAMNKDRSAIGPARKYHFIVHLFISEASTHTLGWIL